MAQQQQNSKSEIINKLSGLKLGAPPSKVQQYRKTPVYTSESHPLYVNWLCAKYDAKNNRVIKDDTDQKEDDPNILSIDFKLGMTICPGKHQNFAATGCEWKRDLTSDLRVLKDKFNTDIIVTLLSESDLKELNVPNLIEEIKKHKMESYWYKIEDGTVPNDADLWKKMVMDVSKELMENKKHVVVHCMGGLNRTGCFVLSVLKFMKIINDDTIQNGVSWIGKSRKGAGGNGSQIQYVKSLKF